VVGQAVVAAEVGLGDDDWCAFLIVGTEMVLMEQKGAGSEVGYAAMSEVRREMID
jgi:hypothetical protein